MQATRNRPRGVPGAGRLRDIFLLAGMALLLQCGTATAATIGERLATILEAPAHRFPNPHARLEWSHLQTFYRERGYAPIWIDADGPRPKARAFVEVLAQAAREGLEPEDYAPQALVALLDGRTPAAPATIEILLSAELLHYAGDLQRGRLAPARADPKLYTYPDDLDRTAVLAGAATTDDPAAYLAGLAPDSRPYRRLRQALAAHRELAAAGGWPDFPEGPTLKPGMDDARVARLRARLAASGDLDAGADNGSTVYDAGLEQAVLRFQRRHGLEPDGAVGPHTQAALNVPVEARIRQIALNMERWRWMPDNLGRRHVHVNLAGFEVDLIEQGESVLNMRAIVGRTYRQTPVFSADMTYLEINPTWTVPPGIARNDILPKLREDPGYLESNGFRVYSGWAKEAQPLDPRAIDWWAVDPKRIPYRLVQMPGPLNALGRIKFMFPNRHHVYLHDTPSRELFRQTVRTFSSGCIRIEKPLELALELLEDQPQWTPEQLQAAIDSGRTRVVRLSAPVPVHLIYATVWVDTGGVVHFRDDIYRRDAKLETVL